ncbi:MAG: LirA/MavJ family T4SS effector [Nostoc sp. DedQUE04]|uniref:LirA/MavJ family T4SS effector n=1 Tax=Nostoc sp. DedQUE04 TaxID=3075390 RepID=UPI002AD46460|nr:LirA/MavJ family T4SS effector [Nostoc sp. DedQUE04]MDZ8137623.1 LirA/MavJ family T4SS effector [Nostoc sp. DedQUE04]
MIEKKLCQVEPSGTSISLLWDGIYNVDEFGRMIVPPTYPSSNYSASYNCTQRFLAFTSNFSNSARLKKLSDIGTDETTSVRIGYISGEVSSVAKLKFIPYEQVLVIPVQVYGIEEISSITLRIYQGGLNNNSKIQVMDTSTQYGNNQSRLLYQESLKREEIFHLQNVNGSTLEETDYAFSKRIANYWGVEDFANWYYQTYTVEVLVFAKPSVSKITDINTNILRCIEHNYIIACDQLNYNYNFRRKDGLFKWLNDFSRIQRLFRNKRLFFTYLQHIEDYLKRNADAELLEALEFFEEQAHFPTIQAIPIGVLSSSTFSQLVTYAYAINDIGVRSCHGGFTHRLQWHAIIHLITKRHTTAIVEGFNYSALELYCTARSGLFDSTNNPNAKFNVDLWRFLFDRFDKYATENDPQSTLSVSYPEQHEDELHYAEQAYMALMNFHPNPRVIQRFITLISRQPAEKSLRTNSCINSLDINNVSNLDIWLERYLTQLDPPSDPKSAFITDKRLRWGCLICSDEWEVIDKKLESQSIHFHDLNHVASKLRSFFFEAVIAVKVVSEFYNNPQLIPCENLHRSILLVKPSKNQPLANALEEVAPYARTLSILRQVDKHGRQLLSMMSDEQGNSIGCLIRTDESLLSQEIIDMLKVRSRLNLNTSKVSTWTTAGIAFP